MTHPRASQLEGYETVRILRTCEGVRPEVRLVRRGDQLAVVKAFPGGNRMRRLLGLTLVPRERGAYERLEGLPGFPKLIDVPDPFTIVIEYIEGMSSHEAGPDLLTPEFFVRLEEIIRSMHSRGVVHADLKRLDNIMVTRDGQPMIIDFSAAFWSGSSLWAAVAIPYFMDEDMRAIYKLKSRRVPHLLTPEEQEFLHELSPLKVAFRRVAAPVRRSIQQLGEHEHNLAR